jgi:hypothetical protein
MKKTILIIFTLISTSSYSQIYFSTNAYMYAKDQVIYVGQDINMQSNSVLYLRNQSQLVQGTTGTSTNKGIGIVSLYQEGTSDNFDYNYWCSPIGNASVATGNENFGITMLHRPTSATASTQAIILPLSNSNGTANPLSIAAKWIYKRINSNNYSQWVAAQGNSVIAAGEGFTMKGTSGTDLTDPEATDIPNNSGGTGHQRYDFRGKANDGNITVVVGANNGTLTGNPYPSALHLNAFLLDPANTACTGIAYFWEQDKTVNSHILTSYRGGYGSYSPLSLGSDGLYVPATFNSYNSDGSLNTTGASSGLVIQRKYAPIGQGFVIDGAANGTVTLKNAHRTYYKEDNPLSRFERLTPKNSKKNDPTTAVSHFKLNVIINNEFTRQLALAFLPEATDGVDRGIDALNMNQTLPNDTYFSLDNDNYVIQGVNFEETKKIPLGVKAADNTLIKFYIPEVTNFNPAQAIYIYDSLDDSYHNIKTQMYEVTVPKGTDNNRFKIAFRDEKALGTEDRNTTQFLISQNNTNQMLSFSNPAEIEIKSVMVYDMLGKLTLSKQIQGNNSHYNFSTSTLSSGIYIVQLLTADDLRTTQKVVVSKSGK